MKKLVITILFISIVAVINAATIYVYVHNVNGNLVYGANVKLYDEFWNYISTQYTNSSGLATFSLLDYGYYNYEVYYYGDANEFWGSDENFYLENTTITRQFWRNWPYLYNHSFSTTNPNVGEEVIIEITVKNNLSYSRSVKVELWIDRDQSSSWDFHETSSAQTVYGGSTRTFTFSMTPSSSGIYYWKSHIKTYNDGAGAYIVTDTYPWSDAFTVSSPPLPELDGIIAFHTYSGFFNYDGIIHILDLSNYSTTDLNFSDWEGCTNPNISPDGLKIVFMAVPHNEHQYNKFEILLYNLENGILSRLTNNSVADEDPKFSPNGHFIVFKRNNDLYKIEISSLDETQITSTLTVQEWAPFYSRYGSKIYYTLSENGNDDIWQIDSNGENAIPIIQGPNDEWYPQTISENSLFYILSDNGDDVYMYDFTSGISEYLITNSSSDDSDPFFISGNYFGFSSTKNYNGYDLYIGDVETGDTWKIYGNETLLDVLGGSYCYPTSIYPENEFFDDFTYTSVDDPELSNFQWYIRTEQGGPGFHCAQWKRDNISFITYPQNQDNILMKISAKTSGDSLNCEQGEIGQEQQRFYQGTYGSRVFFTDNPQYWDDLTVQAFFSINTNSSPQVYSECDFEYLAYDNNWWWGPGLYETTWEDENNKTTDYQSNIIEGWHVLLFQIYDDVVNYYIDGVKVATHNGIYYPESEMSIVFNHWFDTLLGNSSEQREHSMIVDWVYHAKDIDILTNQVETIIASFKMGSTQRYDSIGGIDIDDDLNINISSLQISQNYPNPFNLVTSFDYHLPKSGFVTINIYNVKGQKITTLMEGWQPIGNYSIKWNSINQSSGVYFYEVIFDDNSIINRCVLLQ